MLQPDSNNPAWDVLVDGTTLPLAIKTLSLLLSSKETSTVDNLPLHILQVEPRSDYGGGIHSKISCTGPSPLSLGLCADIPHVANFKETIPPSSGLVDKNLIFNLHWTPTLFYSKGPFVDLLIKSKTASYLEFKLIEKSLLWDEQLGLVPVPISKEDIFTNAEVSLIQKRRIMKIFNLSYKLDELENFENEVESFRKSDLISICFKDFLESFKLPGKVVSMILFPIGQFSCWKEVESVSAFEGIRRLKKFMEAMGSYGNHAFLYPIYGLSEVVQAFSRASAVLGATHILGAALSLKEKQDIGTYHFHLESDQLDPDQKTLLAKKVISASAISDDLVGSRVIFITKNSLLSSSGLLHIIIPPSDTLSYTIELMQLNSDVKECPENFFVVYAVSRELNSELVLCECLKVLKDSEIVYQASFNQKRFSSDGTPEMDDPTFLFADNFLDRDDCLLSE